MDLAKSTTSREYNVSAATSTTSPSGPIAVAVFFMNVVVRAWFACARMAPSGTLVATQTAPGAKAPLPTSSIAHASPSASTHEKLSPSLAYPCVATSRSMSAIASRHVRHRWRAIQMRLP
jgi:hypothetical protein